MTSYTPAEFAEFYHTLDINDPAQKLVATVELQGYVNGWRPEANTEYYALLGVLAAKLKAKSPAAVLALSQPFHIKGTNEVDDAEEWYIQSIRRAYECRASPEEFIDALRLAHFCGRAAKFGGVQAYADKFFGLDCNTFAGNWLGISPSTAIFAYAHGYGGGAKLPGATADVYATRNRIPLAPITDPQAVSGGNVVCTYGSADSRGFRWRHIALVQDVEWVGGNTFNLWLAEWGTKGNIEKHRTPIAKPRVVTITAGKYCDALKGEVAAFDGTDPNGQPAKRIFFDHTTLDDLPHRGWHVSGVYGV